VNEEKENEMSNGIQEVLVTGMTCGHCVASVSEELSELPEVQDVTVDLRVGGESRVTIVTSAPVGDDRIRSAVEEAGYAVAGSTGA
jgi:copper chaperone CopZ